MQICTKCGPSINTSNWWDQTLLKMQEPGLESQHFRLHRPDIVASSLFYHRNWLAYLTSGSYFFLVSDENEGLFLNDVMQVGRGGSHFCNTTYEGLSKGGR